MNTKKLETVCDKTQRKLDESNAELGRLTKRAIVLSQDLPDKVKREEMDTEEEMEVDDDRRRKRSNETRDERVEPKRK